MIIASLFLPAVLAAASAGFVLIYFLLRTINETKVDNEKAQQIADAIKVGAFTFLREEYKIIGLVVLPVVLLLAYTGGIAAAFCFIIGALFSLLCGFIGMNAATDANVRTTMAAKEKGEHAAFQIAFLGGGVMGFAVASFGVLGLGLLTWYFYPSSNFISLLSSFGFGASLVAFFARVGGVFTQSLPMSALIWSGN